MRLFKYVAALPLMASAATALKPLAEFDVEPEIVTRDDSELENLSPAFSELFDYAHEFMDILQQHSDGNLEKRDTLEDVLTGVLTQVKDNQVVQSILLEVASSKQQIDNLSRAVYSLLANMMTGNSALSGLNITLDMNSILAEVMASGLITSVADDLLLNDQNRENLTYHVGDLLTQRPFIAEILNKVGHGSDLTFDMIFSTSRNFKSKAPELQDNTTFYSKRSDIFSKRADSDYLGSLNAFVSNIINSATLGGLIDQSLGSILAAVKNSGLVTPIVLTAVQRPVMDMVGRILNNLYDYGVFDSIPLNDYFEDAKKTHVLADSTQDLLTHKRYSPPVAKLFQQLEDQGTLENVRRSLYG